jgi:hypothetical protein
VPNHELLQGTSLAEILHAAEDMSHRPGWKSHVLDHYSDGYPKGSDFWCCVWFGANGKLDPYHWCARPCKLLKPHHESFGEMQRELSRAIYSYDKDIEIHIDKHLREGTLNGTIHSEEMIKEIKASGVWIKRYRKYFPCPTFSAEDVTKKVEAWVKLCQ